MHSSVSTSARRSALGAQVADGITTFNVWAPEVRNVELVVESRPGNTRSVRAMSRDDRGYWSAGFEDLGAGTLYRYRLDGADDRLFPDPPRGFSRSASTALRK